MADLQAGERAPGVGVEVRRALAGQVGQEGQSVGARRAALGLGEQDVVGRVEDVAQPAQRPRRRQHHAHRVPLARHREAERVQARLRVGAVGRQHTEHDAGRAERD